MKSPETAPTNEAAKMPGGPAGWRNWQLGLLLAIAVMTAYLPALNGGFIWDDNENVINNQTLRSLTGLQRIWFKPGATQQYYPLTHTSFWIDHHLWGLNPLPYHVENVFLHILSALLLWQVLRRLAVTGAWLGTALFALHPVCVESVAWITERKNTVSGVFFLGAILMGIRFWLPGGAKPSVGKELPDKTVEVPEYGPWKCYWLALWLYLCAIWGKSAAVGLPAVLLLLIWWKRGKIGWRNVCLILPYFVAGVVFGLITMWVEKYSLGASGEEWRLSWPQRCVLAGRAVWFYLGKLAWPHPLEFMYPRWAIRASEPLAWLPLAAAAAVIWVLWRRRESWGRPGLNMAGYFIAMLFPVLGFFDVYFYRFSFVCDHFQYLACMGPLALAGAGLCAAGIFKGENRMREQAACGVLLLALWGLTWKQSGMYANAETLWRATVQNNPASWMAHLNLGTVLSQAGRESEAAAEFKKTLALRPEEPRVYNNLGTLAGATNLDEAMNLFRKAIALDGRYADAYYNLGVILERKGMEKEAMTNYETAVQLNPNKTEAHINLGSLELQAGRTNEALAHFLMAVQINPNFAEAHNHLGIILDQMGRADEATRQFQEALRLDPKMAANDNSLGLGYAMQGKLADAAQMFSSAARLDPGMAQAHWNLGKVWLQTGMVAEGLAEMKKGLELSPENEKARGLGETLAKMRKAAANAVTYCETAVKADPNNAHARFELGTAYLARKEPEKGLAEFQEAARLAPESPDYLNALARVYATCPKAELRNAAEAVRLAEKACTLTKRQNAALLDTLAAADAEAGWFADAVKTAEEARAAAVLAHDSMTAMAVEQRLELYKAGKSYREEP